MIYALLAIGVLALIGHFSVFVTIINRIHAVDMPHWLIRICNLIWYFFFLGIPMAIGGWLLALSMERHSPSTVDAATSLVICYALICSIAAIVVGVHVSTGKRQAPKAAQLCDNHTFIADVAQILGSKPTGDLSTRLAARVPRNEIFQLSVHEKTVAIPRLEASLGGLSIAHVSDLHFTGQITKAFFHEVIGQTNELKCDLVLISGDIVDKRKCLTWIPEILGRLRAPLGCYFVLGNHDKRVQDDDAVIDALKQANLIDLGGRWKLIDAKGTKIVLAGNELPWYVPAADMKDCPFGDRQGRYLRIAVSHSPDQFDWARANDFDLMVAGHTHGGQFRFPRIGPILSPSRQGVRYASGTFYQEPTLLHVSRGISGTRPLRFNCRPELAKLILVRP